MIRNSRDNPLPKIDCRQHISRVYSLSSTSCWLVVCVNSCEAWILTAIVLSGNASRASLFLHSSATKAFATISCCCFRLVLVAVTSDFCNKTMRKIELKVEKSTVRNHEPGRTVALAPNQFQCGNSDQADYLNEETTLNYETQWLSRVHQGSITR